MDNTSLLKVGIIGSIVSAICCFTPVLGIVLGVAGLSAWIGMADFVLFPALAIFILTTVYALWTRSKAR